ncbi:CocE/NonD family hydrolase [Paenibacillus protaetiae]|uniref:CocE/NonD family hydrolase n=1 Tax=Paenibacillus protaetiae TaxID=2509456 RepID=A0A4P6F672_9BACL|nr:CocE/NonD family hydrolase [Paenibacillus protaetiae]QAY65898.1 CocE/NonD family hydrolase [Paenibacillus protaetiae]
MTTYYLYCAGVYEGTIRFTENAVMHAKVDARRRTQMQENVLDSKAKYVLPLEKIRAALPLYRKTEWTGQRVTVENGETYHRHTVFEDGGRVSQVWAKRGDTAVDIVTLDGEVIAFLCPNRYGMELLVLEGMEKLTPLAGYADAKLSRPDYGVNDLGTFLVPMRDGVKLATDVYLPEGIKPGTRLPTILVRTCYDRNGRKESFMRWANKGYAVVNQDVRGRADSEGELIPFYYEREDGSDTIDWIISQDWSNGDVGMWGASYLGYVVMAASTSGHPNLKAVVNEVNVGSPFVDTVRRGGTVCSWPLLCWTLAQSVGTRTDFDIFGGITVDPAKAVDARPIRDIPQQMIGRSSGPWDLWSEHPEYDSYWSNCTHSERAHQIKAPMFVISGWYDGDSAGVSETWRLLTEHDVPNRKIWLGPWEHGPNRARDLHGVAFGEDAVVYDYDINVLRWFDHFLKGIDNGIEREPRASYYVVGENKWRTSSDWTPAESVVTPFYLGSGGRANSAFGDGTLSSSLPVRTEPDIYVYNPSDPVADSGERIPENRRAIELRQDVLCYTSDKLDRSLDIAGELSAVLYAASSAVDTDWVVALSDVDEADNSILLSSYIIRAKYRLGYDKPELLTPDKAERFDIFMPNIAHRFAAGHRIRFSVTSSSKFVAFPNSNTGLNPYDDPEPVPATQTIYHSEQYPSCVLLPVLQ